MYRKIAIIFFILALLVVAGGAYYFFLYKDQQVSTSKDTALPPELAEVVEQQQQNTLSEIDLAKQQAEQVAQLKQQIKTAIKTKDALIRSTGNGRPYTQDEVDFVLNPRENIIKEMLAKGTLSQAQVDLLNSTK